MAAVEPLLVLNTALSPNFTCVIRDGKTAGLQISSAETSFSIEGMDLMIKAMEEGDTPLSAISGFIFVIGPGSFTGIRTGLSMLKGMAFGRPVNAAGVSALRILASPFFGSGRAVCPVLDARMNQIYAALFSGNGRRLQPDQAIEPALFAERLEGNVLFAGADARKFEQDLVTEKVSSSEFKPLTLEQIVNGTVQEGLEMFRMGEVVPVREMTPLYLRKSYAEIKSDKTNA